MHTRPLGSTGPQISALGLGYMGMSALYGDADRSRMKRSDQQGHRRRRGSSGGRSRGFDHETYRRRNSIERCFNRLKGFRGLATRYDKTATSYEPAVCLAWFLLRARLLRPRTPKPAHQVS